MYWPYFSDPKYKALSPSAALQAQATTAKQEWPGRAYCCPPTHFLGEVHSQMHRVPDMHS